MVRAHTVFCTDSLSSCSINRFQNRRAKAKREAQVPGSQTPRFPTQDQCATKDEDELEGDVGDQEEDDVMDAEDKTLQSPEDSSELHALSV